MRGGCEELRFTPPCLEEREEEEGAAVVWLALRMRGRDTCSVPPRTRREDDDGLPGESPVLPLRRGLKVRGGVEGGEGSFSRTCKTEEEAEG
jgi:hypothetical protein